MSEVVQPRAPAGSCFTQADGARQRIEGSMHVGLVEAEHSFKTNVVEVRAADRMVGTILDTFA